MDLNIIINKLQKAYYENIIEQMDKNNINSKWLSDIIKDKYSKNSTELIDTSTEIHSENKSEKKPELTDYVYKKPWNKLNYIHKVLKIKEFINNLNTCSNNEKDRLKNEAIDLVKQKVLSKKEKVNYDETNGKLVSILNLQYKDNKYYFDT